MTIKMLCISIIAFLFALSASAQEETNPKLVNTFPTRDGAVLVMDKWDNLIQVSDISSLDLKTMQETVGELLEENEDQEKTINDQKKEINRLKDEIEDLKSDYKDLLQAFKSFQKQIDGLEKKLP